MTKLQRELFTVMVYFIVPFSGICVDVYVPSLPHVVNALGTTTSLVRLTIPLYTFGMAIVQLFIGPLSDSFGRKPLMILGASLQLLCLLVLIAFPTIEVLLITRVLQGICVAMIVVPARVIIMDIFDSDAAKKRISLATVFWALGPIVGPAIGGYLQYYFGWISTFYFMLGYDVVILLLAVLVLRETLACKMPFSVKTTYANFKILMTDKIVLATIMLAGIMVSYMLLFNVVAPFFVQNVLGYSAIAYGQIALLIGGAWLVGTLISQLLFHVPLSHKAKFSLWVVSGIAIAMTILSQMLSLQLWYIVLSTVLIVAASGIIFPVFISNVMQRYPKMIGTLSAFVFFGIWFFAAVVTTLGSVLKTQSIAPLDETYFGLAILALVVFYGMYRRFYQRSLAVINQ